MYIYIYRHVSKSFFFLYTDFKNLSYETFLIINPSPKLWQK